VKERKTKRRDDKDNERITSDRVHPGNKEREDAADNSADENDDEARQDIDHIDSISRVREECDEGV